MNIFHKYSQLFINTNVIFPDNTDYVAVYDGDLALPNNLIGKFQGTVVPARTLVSSNNVMFVQFHSDDKFQDRGFNATFETKREWKVI